MTPPCKAFPVSELELQVQADPKGKKRKLEGGADVDLSKCALRMMTQYRCIVEDPESRHSPVGCWPVQRFFRQCKDKKGTFTVETTIWEGLNAKAKYRENSGKPDGNEDTKNDGKQHTYHQWSQAWEDEE